MRRFLTMPLTYVARPIASLLGRMGLEPLLHLRSPVFPPQEADGGGDSSWVGLAVPEEDLERAKGLLAELKHWATALGLGSGLSAAQLLDAMRRYQEESVQEIVDLLKKRSERDDLANCLLFLALSEQADREDDLLDDELEQLGQEQARLKTIIQGVEERVIQERMAPRLRPLPELSSPRQRMRAWTMALTLAQGLTEGTILLGLTIGIKDLLEATGERRMKGPVGRDLASFSIPPDLTALDGLLASMGSELREMLHGIPKEREPSWEERLSDLAARWNDQAEGAPPVMRLVVAGYDHPVEELLTSFLPEEWAKEPPALGSTALYLV